MRAPACLPCVFHACFMQHDVSWNIYTNTLQCVVVQLTGPCINYNALGLETHSHMYYITKRCCTRPACPYAPVEHLNLSRFTPLSVVIIASVLLVPVDSGVWLFCGFCSFSQKNISNIRQGSWVRRPFAQLEIHIVLKVINGVEVTADHSSSSRPTLAIHDIIALAG